MIDVMMFLCSWSQVPTSCVLFMRSINFINKNENKWPVNEDEFTVESLGELQSLCLSPPAGLASKLHALISSLVSQPSAGGQTHTF